ncbi:hypothetical protein [Alkaliphilus peptidifermentans]|uniref:Uncharacterized protein n=1 Tax=Alkaliphilus peptidifermentans DSM 18978 TaxID=1120976 RepID=A0A1G5GFN8_9FIRM|nr:hypothetical protein [Alkaliphilus peptidifermentans]SCY50373.1 hypothetical protein SAMN03080606_01674 [Alkaliphilus peptidifermentans DSM 18978]
MSEKTDGKSVKDNNRSVYMQADIIDQINTNQQSNMTLSAYSTITQSYSNVKINNA